MDLSAQALPIIDLSSVTTTSSKDNSSYEYLAKQIATACEAAGCFYMKNHGVDSDVIQNAFDDLRHFFGQSADYKLRFVDPNGNLDRGYEPFETRNVNAFMGRFGLPNDPVEKYAFGAPPTFFRPVPENIWPDVPPMLKRNVELYYDQMRILAERLMRLFSVAAQAPTADFFYDQCHQGEHILRANFYPKADRQGTSQSTRFGEHTDSTPFTILATDDTPGSLQVKNADGLWVHADPVPGTMFVNLGDFMALWTNDKWKATVHKVVWPEKGIAADRLSLVYFLLVDPETVVECLPSCVGQGATPKYRPTSHADYVNARMARLAGRY